MLVQFYFSLFLLSIPNSLFHFVIFGNILFRITTHINWKQKLKGKTSLLLMFVWRKKHKFDMLKFYINVSCRVIERSLWSESARKILFAVDLVVGLIRILYCRTWYSQSRLFDLYWNFLFQMLKSSLHTVEDENWVPFGFSYLHYYLSFKYL